MEYKLRQAVIRKTLTGDWEAFTFTNQARYFFVKNFTDGDIYVSFLEDTADDKSFLIKSEMGEEVSITFKGDYIYNEPNLYVKTIYVKGTGVVEVEELDSYEKLEA